jgi:hypothetical protein
MIRGMRAAGFLSIALAASPIVAQQDHGLRFVAEIGFRRDDGEFLARALDVAREGAFARAAADGADETAIRGWLIEHGAALLPVSMSMWVDPATVDGGWAPGIAVFDLGGEFDLGALLERVAAAPLSDVEDAWETEIGFVRRLPTQDGTRVLLSSVDPRGEPWFGGAGLAQPSIKTLRDLYKPLEKLLLELHPYDQPEIVATACVEISGGYQKWLNEQVKPPGKG